MCIHVLLSTLSVSDALFHINLLFPSEYARRMVTMVQNKFLMFFLLEEVVKVTSTKNLIVFVDQKEIPK